MKKDSIILALASLMVLLFISCENSNSKLTTDKEEAKVIAEEAYIFAYPMLLNHQIMYMQALNTEGAKYQQPFNKFSHIRELLTADFTDIVGPNNNTLYSLSWLDLRSDPQVLTVPPIADERFYVLQIIDMFNIYNERTMPSFVDSKHN